MLVQCLLVKQCPNKKALENVTEYGISLKISLKEDTHAGMTQSWNTARYEEHFNSKYPYLF